MPQLKDRSFSRTRLRELRRAAGLSLQDVSIAVHRSWPTVRGYEDGKITPPTDALPLLADLLGAKIDDLFEVIGP